MTKSELRDHLKAGYFMDDAFIFGPGQECMIFKADEFKPGDEIIYIPDTHLNEIPIGTTVTDDEIIDEVIGKCYTGDDFIEECGGDEELAERLFWYCDWQHPGSALPEVEDEDEGSRDKANEDGANLELPRHLRPWTVRLCETVYDITLAAQHMLEFGEVESDDSRGLFSSILQWAIEFEREHPGPWDETDYPADYMELIDNYAYEKLMKAYGKEKPL